MSALGPIHPVSALGPIEPSGEKCTAMVTDKTTGERRRCINWPVTGCRVCRMHGAGAPQVKAAAARRLKAQRVAQHVSDYSLPRDVDPETAMLEEVHRCAGAVAWLGQKVASFDVDDDLKQLDMTCRFEKPSVWIEMYWKERERLLAAAKACADVGIAERQVKLAESQGEQLANVLRVVLADLFRELLEALSAAGVSVDVVMRIQQEKVPEILRRRLMEVAGGAA